MTRKGGPREQRKEARLHAHRKVVRSWTKPNEKGNRQGLWQQRFGKRPKMQKTNAFQNGSKISLAPSGAQWENESNARPTTFFLVHRVFSVKRTHQLSLRILGCRLCRWCKIVTDCQCRKSCSECWQFSKQQWFHLKAKSISLFLACLKEQWFCHCPEF